MKALLLLEFETFIKKKQFIFLLLYILFSICSLFYIVKVKSNYDNPLMLIFSIQLINVFARHERPLKKSYVPVSTPCERKNKYTFLRNIYTQYNYISRIDHILFSMSKNGNYMGCTKYYRVY